MVTSVASPAFWLPGLLVVLVASDDAGEPRFHRPADDAKLADWAREFAPGRLYTMGSLHEAAQ